MRARQLTILTFGALAAVAIAQWLRPGPDKSGRVPVVDSLLPSPLSRPRKGGLIDMVVVHFCSNVLGDPAHPYELEAVKRIFVEGGVSAHYLIDRAGRVHRLVPEACCAFHAGRGALPWRPNRLDILNETSIGVELMAIGTPAEMALFMSPSAYGKIPAEHIGFTAEQYAALRQLLDDLHDRWPGIELDRRHIVGHDLYAPGRRSDPGALFDWSQLNLKL